MMARWICLLAAAVCCPLLASGGAGAQTSQDRAGESWEGAQPSTPSPNETGRAEQIIGSARGTVSLSDAQRQKLQQYFSAHKHQAVNQSDVPVTVGAAVPRQVELRDLPQDVTDTLQKYFGDSYFFAGDRLVIVEPKVRRIVAVVPHVG